MALAPAAAAGSACHAERQEAAAETLFTFNALIYAASGVASPQEYNDLRQFLLVYQPDEALDRAYPVRTLLAESVRRWPMALRQRALHFLLEHRAAATNYNALVLQIFGPAPSFVASDMQVPGGANEQHVFNHRLKLQNLLREAYRIGNLQATWRQGRAAWESTQLCDDRLVRLQGAVARYLRVAAPPALAQSTVISNPLMPLGSGVTSVFSDRHFVMLIGPTASLRDQDVLVSHELAHPLLHEIFHNDARLRAALADSSCVFEDIRRDPVAAMLTRHVYSSWESYFSESLVRTISHRLGGLTDPGRGFALTHLLDAEMARYERGTPRFADAMVALLARLQRGLCHGVPQVLNTAAVDGSKLL